MEVPPETLDALAGWFAQSHSSDSAARRAAEESLSSAADFPDFALALLGLSASPRHDLRARVAASVHFKNLLRRRWPKPDSDTADQLPASDCAIIKAHLLQLLLTAPALIQAQLSEALAVAAASDFPARWDSLLPSIVLSLGTAVNAGDVAATNFLLVAAAPLFSRFRNAFDNNALRLDLKYCLEIFADPLLEVFLFASRQLQAASTVADPLVLRPLFECLRLCCEIFYSLNSVDLPEFFEDNMSQWMTEFRGFFTTSYPPPVEADGAPDGLRAAVCDNLLLVAQTASPSRVQPALTAVSLMATVADSLHHELFGSPEAMKQICDSVVVPNLRLRHEDEELFEVNGMEYVRRDSEGSDVDTLRRAACRLLRGLAANYQEQVVALVSAHVYQMLAASAADRASNWKEKDAAIHLVIALMQKPGATGGGTPVVDMESFFISVIVPELQASDWQSEPMLKATALRFLKEFSDQIPQATALAFLPRVVRFLTHESYVISSYAVTIIENLLTVKDMVPVRVLSMVPRSTAGLGSYARKLSRLLEPDKLGALLVLHYIGELREPARDSLRAVLRKTGSEGVFVGRMNLLRKLVPNYLPPEVGAIYKCIQPNSVLVFGPLCSGWWFRTIQTVKTLKMFENGNLLLDRFFLGYQELNFALVELFGDTNCPDRRQTAMDTEFISQTYGCRLVSTATNEMVVKAGEEFASKLYDSVWQLWKESLGCVSLEVYRALPKLVSKQCASLVCKSIDGIFRELFTELREQAAQMSNSADTLKMICDAWNSRFLLNFQEFFSALNFNDPGFVRALAFEGFRDEIILSSELGFSQRVIDVFTLGRAQMRIETVLMRRVIRMLMDLDAYVDVFERPFLKAAALHYNVELSCHTVEELCHQLDYEVGCSSGYLTSDALSKLTDVLSAALLGSRSESLKSYLLSGQDAGGDLLVIGKINNILGELHRSNVIISPWIKGCFDECMLTFSGDPTSSLSPVVLIGAIICFVDRSRKVVETVFGNDFELPEYLQGKITDLISANLTCYGEYLSIFADLKLRDMAKGIPGGQLLDKMVDLVELLKSKDFFEEYYLCYLARRLAYGATDLEEERSLLQKFGSWAVKLKGHGSTLIENSVMSDALLESFGKSSAGDAGLLSVKVFDSSKWPLALTRQGVPNTCQLPPELLHICERFTSHFNSLPRRGGQKVTWCTDFGDAVLDWNIGGRTHSLRVTTHQMCVLMLFNSQDFLTVGDIEDATAIPSAQLKDTLASLWRMNVLVSSTSKGGETSFSINEQYSPESPQVAPEEPEPDFSRTVQKVEANRSPAIEAGVVRVMKLQRTLLHTELVAAVVTYLSKYFEADVSQVKKGIEDMMARGFIVRDGANAELYHYVD